EPQPYPHPRRDACRLPALLERRHEVLDRHLREGEEGLGVPERRRGVVERDPQRTARVAGEGREHLAGDAQHGVDVLDREDDLEVEIARSFAEGKRILEAGCGTGRILSRLAGVAAEAVGADLSRGMLQGSRRRGLEVVESDLGALPFRDGAFDLVYSFKVLAHVPHLEEALREMARVVRPGGTLLLEFYNPWSLRYLGK